MKPAPPVTRTRRSVTWASLLVRDIPGNWSFDHSVEILFTALRSCHRSYISRTADSPNYNEYSPNSCRTCILIRSSTRYALSHWRSSCLEWPRGTRKRLSFGTATETAWVACVARRIVGSRDLRRTLANATNGLLKKGSRDRLGQSTSTGSRRTSSVAIERGSKC
jgi:hypothetical protein